MKKLAGILISSASFFFSLVIPSDAEVNLLDNGGFVLTMAPYLRTDGIVLKNTVGLDSGNKDDASAYLGIDYGLAFDLKAKGNGHEAYLLLERNGPFDYDAPLFIHNTLVTSIASVERYRGSELLPHVEGFWYDLPLQEESLRLKGGLFIYEVGHDIVSPSDYENYAASIYSERENFRWEFYYCRPDLVNKSFLGPSIWQERGQGIHYTPNKADFFAANAVFSSGRSSWQPFAQVLYDRSGKRSNVFSAPTHDDILGTLGLVWRTAFKRLSLGIEAARNFGRARSSDPAFKDVEHCGYLFYGHASYALLEKFVSHFRFALASGNKVPLEAAADTTFTSGKNRSFSVYSPLNTNLADSIYPEPEFMPLVAMGGGNGLNYGIRRPGTFSDPYLFENLVLFCLGFDYQLSERFSMTFDWWYLRSKERGVGTFAGSNKALSPDLGNELDMSLNYELNNNISFCLSTGYFFPGRFYREDRDDPGSLFTPFLRGDGEADAAYQVEISMTLSY